MRWERWVLGMVAISLIAWIGRAEGKMDLVSRIEERLSAIQNDIKELKQEVKQLGRR